MTTLTRTRGRVDVRARARGVTFPCGSGHGGHRHLAAGREKGKATAPDNESQSARLDATEACIASHFSYRDSVEQHSLQKGRLRGCLVTVLVTDRSEAPLVLDERREAARPAVAQQPRESDARHAGRWRPAVPHAATEGPQRPEPPNQEDPLRELQQKPRRASSGGQAIGLRLQQGLRGGASHHRRPDAVRPQDPLGERAVGEQAVAVSIRSRGGTPRPGRPRELVHWVSHSRVRARLAHPAQVAASSDRRLREQPEGGRQGRGDSSPARPASAQGGGSSSRQAGGRSGRTKRTGAGEG